MEFVSKTVCVKQWLLFVLFVMSGYGAGTIVGNLARALGL
jgi:hypothetical protein